jgi:phosphoglycolate phosphatase-like HAD superfamily hydrolase
MYVAGIRRAPNLDDSSSPETKHVDRDEKERASMTEFEFLRSSPDLITENIGKWMAIVGKDVVAVGDSVKDVLAQAKARYPGSEPFVAKFPRATVMLL